MPTPMVLARRRRLRRAALVGLVLGTASAVALAQAPAAPPAPPPGLDGGVDADALLEADAGDAAPDAEDPAERARLEALVSALEALLAGRLEGELPLSELLGVDLSDDAAVVARRDALARQLADAQAATEAPPDAGPEAEDAGPDAPEEGGSDAGAPAASPVPPADAGSPGDAGDADAGDGPDAALPEAPEAPVAPSLEDLGRRVAALQVAVLELPPTRRAALLALERERIRAAVAREERAQAEAEARAADEARARAQAEAEAARTAVARVLAEERAKIEAFRAAQARARLDVADRRAGSERARTEGAQRATTLEARADAAGARSADADGAYDALVTELVALREEASAALSAYEAGWDAPTVGLDAARLSGLGAEVEGEVRQLRSEAESLEREAEDLAAASQALAWRDAHDAISRESRLNLARIRLLDRVTDDKRSRVLGFGDEGLAQLGREVRRLGLESRWLLASSERLAASGLADLRAPAALTMLLGRLVVIALVAFAGIGLTRRLEHWLAWLRSAAQGALRVGGGGKALQSGIRAVAAVRAELVTMGAVWLAPRLARLDVEVGPLATLYTLAWAIALYRFVTAAAHRGISFWAAGGARLADATSDRILRSVRLVGRAALALVAALSISAAVLGEGYLFHLVQRAAWVVGALVALWLLRTYQGDIADAYLRLRGGGALADRVRAHRGTARGFLVTIAAFAGLVVVAAGRAGRRFVLGFEQSRRALAYLFRRKLERRADDGVVAAPLPQELAAFYEERAAPGPEVELDRWPGIERFESALEVWRAGRSRGAMLLVGRTGYGKTSWLARAERAVPEGIPVHRVELRRRALTGPALAAAIGAALQAPEEARADVNALGAWLAGRPRSVVVLDEAQLCFLRGELAGLHALHALVEATGTTVFWLASFAHYAYEHATWARRGAGPFRLVEVLAPWSEEDIGRLLGQRNAASGWTFVYDDLVVDPVEEQELEAHVAATVRDYNRLVWDFSEGAPRIALRMWRESLVPDGDGRVRVRLFRGPPAALLEALDADARFVLGAVVWHERASVEELARTLRIEAGAVREAVSRLLDAGVLEHLDELQVRVSVPWWSTVVRFLRRKHLIES